MAQVDWEEECEPLPIKLRHFGKTFYKRFMDEKKSPLYEPQRKALQNLVTWFSKRETENLTAVVVMPTGSGKTGVICCLPYTIGGAIENKEISSDKIDVTKPVLIIAPGIDILRQLKENLVTSPFLMKVGLLRPKEKDYNYVVRTVEKSSEVRDLKYFSYADIILSNSQKWRKEKDGTPNYEDLPSDSFSMVIVDEAHHLPAKQWEAIMCKFRNNAKIVFFTATPNRADGKEITTDLSISIKGYAYKLSREDAIKNKLICDITPVFLPFEREPRSTEETFQSGDEVNSLGLPPAKRVKPEESEVKRSFSLGFERIKYAEPVLLKIKQLIKKKNEESPLPGGKKHASIVITYNIEEAKTVGEKCVTELGFPKESVQVVNSAEVKNEKERDKVMQKIKSGQIEIVIIVKMLLEGFDYPPLSIAGIVTRIHSPVKFAQFIGRVQRVLRDNIAGKTEVGDKMVAHLITHEYFKQKELFDEYINPHITDDENQSIDEDDNGYDEDNKDFAIDGDKEDTIIEQ